jgi:hypothetical protein
MNNPINHRSQPSVLTINKTTQRAVHHFKTLGRIAGTALLTAVIYLILDRDNSLLGGYNSNIRWITLIAGAVAIWFLIRDWVISGDMTFVFDGDRRIFQVLRANRISLELSFNAIKRIKIEETSNLFPVYLLSIHLQHGQVIEIDASGDKGELHELAEKISGLTGKKIVVQYYNEPLSEGEKEDQQRSRWEGPYKGD